MSSNFDIFNPSKNNMKGASDWNADSDRQSGIAPLSNAKSMTINTLAYSNSKVVKALMDMVNDINDPSTPYDMDISQVNLKNALLEWYNKKIDKANIASTLGTSEAHVASQALLNNAKNNIENGLENGSYDLRKNTNVNIGDIGNKVVNSFSEARRRDSLAIGNHRSKYTGNLAEAPLYSGPEETGLLYHNSILNRYYKIKYFRLIGICPSDNDNEYDIDLFNEGLVGENFSFLDHILETKGFILKPVDKGNARSTLPYVTKGGNVIGYGIAAHPDGETESKMTFYIHSSYSAAGEWFYNVHVYYYDIDDEVNEPE